MVDVFYLMPNLISINFESLFQMMLLQLLEDGPATVGIFRRSPNARAMRELRNKLDEGEEVDFKECSVFVTAALIKDFLRCELLHLCFCEKKFFILFNVEF